MNLLLFFDNRIEKRRRKQGPGSSRFPALFL
uniref:Uncharacterized protein n=1 Tax=Podoviridae sp. ctIlO27 TaxID=2825238 RepID=A0A8S5PXJ2_9CAUD|nr:MAG TPA: hypothetical protein [Podoviridae sp. ctIlO27]